MPSSSTALAFLHAFRMPRNLAVVLRPGCLLLISLLILELQLMIWLLMVRTLTCSLNCSLITTPQSDSVRFVHLCQEIEILPILHMEPMQSKSLKPKQIDARYSSMLSLLKYKCSRYQVSENGMPDSYYITVSPNKLGARYVLLAREPQQFTLTQSRSSCQILLFSRSIRNTPFTTSEYCAHLPANRTRCLVTPRSIGQNARLVLRSSSLEKPYGQQLEGSGFPHQ